MQTVIINPISKGRAAKMKRKKYSHKKRTHGKRKGKINAGLKAWIKKHKGKRKMKNAPGDDKSKMYAGSYVRKHSKYKKHKRGRKRRVKSGMKRSRPVFYIKKGKHSPIPAHTLKRSPWKKLNYALANPRKIKKYRKHRKSGGIRIMKNPLNMLKGAVGGAPSIAYGAAGFIGMNALMNLPFLSGITGNWPRIGVKALLTAGLAMAAKMVFKKADISEAVMIGAGMSVVVEVVDALKLNAILPVDVVRTIPATTTTTTSESGASMIITKDELNSIVYQ